MDIGEVGGDYDDEGTQGYEEGGYGEIDAVVGNHKCHKCQGWGHFARECPSS